MGDRLGSPLGAVSFLSPSTCRPGQCGEEEVGSYLALHSDLRIESGRGAEPGLQVSECKTAQGPDSAGVEGRLARS